MPKLSFIYLQAWSKSSHWNFQDPERDAVPRDVRHGVPAEPGAGVRGELLGSIFMKPFRQKFTDET
jgi:hypothetical protein